MEVNPILSAYQMKGEKMKQGKASVRFKCPPRISGYSSIAGKMEGEGPLGHKFDVVCDDPYFGGTCFEEAESKMQSKAIEIALKKSGLSRTDIRYLIGGDLLGQLIATSYGIEDYSIPFYGIYGACSTLGEGLSITAMLVAAGYADHAMTLTSSHNASAEKQFRFPNGYGNQKPLSATWTVTGSAAFVISAGKCDAGKEKKGCSSIVITGCTTGKVVDYGVKDSMHMGAVMAPAAADVIATNFEDFERTEADYDLIVTGDLGKIGQNILYDILRTKGYEIKGQHFDCGVKIFACDEQDTHSGGSGCGCSAITLAGYILPKLRAGDWKRILFVPTGALLSPVSFNEGNSVPAIAHAVVIERNT